MKLIKLINKVLNKFNAQILRYPSVDINRRMKIFNHLNINLVLDVGANIGNFSLELIELGYKSKIISFEPLSSAYEKLELIARRNKNWYVYNYALGDLDGTSIINISKNSDSSSLLEMLPSHLETAPQSKYISKETIVVKKLDTIFSETCNATDNIYLKIDTQGFEKKVLDGGVNSLKTIKAIQIELSLIPLYENALLYKEIVEFLEKRGFKLVSIENGFYNASTGELLQFDGVFIKS